MVYLLFSALVACTSTVRTAPEIQKRPSNFKGLKIGMTVKEAKQAVSLKGCRGLGKHYYCEIPTELMTFTVGFEDGRLSHIRANFLSSQFDEVERIFTEKYGKPSDREIVIQNAFGASYVQRMLYWSGEGFTISLDRFASSSEKAPGAGTSYDLTKGEMFILSDTPDSETKKTDERKKHILD